MNISDHCSGPECGYAAAFIACVCFGSFAVPMKGKTAHSVDIDPMVFQSYKTTMSLLTSLSVLFLGVDRLRFTPWGIVSGMFWVPGGMLHVCGVRTAGLAISHGICASIVVMVSFSWGIFIFHERVRSLSSALGAVFLMVLGIGGMSYFSSPQGSSDGAVFAVEGTKEAKGAIFCFSPCSMGARLLCSIDPAAAESSDLLPPKRKDMDRSSLPIGHSDNGKSADNEDPELQSDPDLLQRTDPRVKKAQGNSSGPSSLSTERAPTIADIGQRPNGTSAALVTHDLSLRKTPWESPEVKGLKPLIRMKGGGTKPRGGTQAFVSGLAYHLKTNYGFDLSVRQMGLACAAFGAVWGGSVMVPLHYAGEETQGLGFVFSFAVGAMLINVLLWVIRYAYLFRVTGDVRRAYESLPPIHLRKMVLPGGTSGFLWSVGNMASIISVTHLGEGVGYSMTQSAMLVSGLWGIFYFGEISSGPAIRGWLASACFTVAGILLLSYNHMPPLTPVILKK